MMHRLLRMSLLMMAIAIGAAAGYLIRNLDNDMTAARAASDTLRDQSRALQGTVADVRASQQAYVAAGQGEGFWMDGVSTLLPALDRQLADLRGAVTSADAQSALGGAGRALENLHKLDSRVRDYVRSGETLVASDLIFSDGLEAAGAISTGIDTALGQELQTRGSGLAGVRRQQLIIVTAASGLVLLVLLALAFTGRSGAPAAVVETAQPTDDAASEPAATAGKPVTPVTIDQSDLTSAAQLCTELARVAGMGDMPRLLARIARVMDASGMVVWIADQAGRELRPVISHGYSDQLLARMGTIASDSSNATAAAYRGAEMRAVPGDGVGNGAIAAPLMTADGCIGVLSVEVRSGGERSSVIRSLAAIFAAQFATLVSVPPAPQQTQTAAQA